MKAVVLLQPGVAAALALLLRLTAWYPLRCSPALTISSIPGCSFWTSKQTIFCLSSLHSPQSFWVFIWNGVVRSLPAAWKNKLLPLEELQDKIPWPVLRRRSGYMIIVIVLADHKIFVIFCFSRADLHPRGCNIRLAFFVKYWCWLFLLSTPYDGNICHSEEFILCTAFIQTSYHFVWSIFNARHFYCGHRLHGQRTPDTVLCTPRLWESFPSKKWILRVSLPYPGVSALLTSAAVNVQWEKQSFGGSLHSLSANVSDSGVSCL